MRFTLLLPLFPLLIGLVTTSCNTKRKHPTDAQLIALYRRELTNLVSVVGMLKQDHGVDGLWLGSGKIRVSDQGGVEMSVERLTEYRALLERMGSSVSVHSFKGESVDFGLSSFGLSVSGSGKGLAYREAKPGFGLVEDTDAQRPRPHIGRSFRLIEGNWYVYYSE